MFCTYCGHQNSDGAKFCGSCGKPLVPVQTQAQNPVSPAHQTYQPQATSYQKPKLSPKWASIGASIAILCFFMPWAMASCGGMSVQVSGWQVSTGNYLEGYQPQAYPGFFLILVFALLGFVSLMGNRTGAIVAVASGIAGLIGMIIFSSGLNNEANANYITVSLMVGYYGEWLGFLTMAGLGIYSLTQGASPIGAGTPGYQQYPHYQPPMPAQYTPPQAPAPVPPTPQTWVNPTPTNSNPVTPPTPPAGEQPKANNWKEIG